MQYFSKAAHLCYIKASLVSACLRSQWSLRFHNLIEYGATMHMVHPYILQEQIILDYSEIQLTTKWNSVVSSMDDIFHCCSHVT